MRQQEEPHIERWGDAFKGRLQLKLLAVVLPLVIFFSVMFYALSVPMISKRVYGIEQEASRNILETVSEIADRIHVSLDTHREQILTSHKRELKTVIDLVEAYISVIQDRVTAGELTKIQARKQILNDLQAFKYGQNDYVWGSSYNEELISHPDPNFHKKRMNEWQDKDGKPILPTMIKLAREQGEGFFQYAWHRLGEEKQSQKLSYFRNFPEWEFVLGTGVYLDDVEHEVNVRKEEAIHDLRDSLRNVKVSETGYVFVFDADLRLLVHPSPSIENIYIHNLINPSSQRPIYKDLIEFADNPDGLRYKWDHPNDRDNFVYEKISFIRHMKELDWYIVSTMYVDELRSSSDQLSERILIVSLIIFVATMLLCWLFIRRLTAPIHRLANTAARVRSGDLNAKSSIVRDDELGLLSQAFDEMVEKLRFNIDTLDLKVKERTEELEATNQKLMEAQRLQAVGQLSGGLAHDFNNLLSVILGNLLPAKERFSHSKELAEYLEPAIRSARRGADITSRLLAFSRKQQLKPSFTDVFEVVQEVAILLKHSIPSNIHVDIKNLTKESSTYVDAAQLENALINLGLNARDAMPKGGRLFISMKNEYFSGALGFDENVLSGEYLQLDVSDQGEGFAENAIDFACEPFFTTKEVGAGSGLGLSMVFGFIKQSNGYVKIANNDNGKGACISLLLPLQDRKVDEENTQDDLLLNHHVPEDIAKGRLVLLVEDDQDVRTVMRRQLSEFGFSVIEAADAQEALVLLSNVSEISLMLSDILMPGEMNGEELARRVVQEFPTVQIILMSGYSFFEGSSLQTTPTAYQILRKPIAKKELKNAIIELNKQG